MSVLSDSAPDEPLKKPLSDASRAAEARRSKDHFCSLKMDPEGRKEGEGEGKDLSNKLLREVLAVTSDDMRWKCSSVIQMFRRLQ